MRKFALKLCRIFSAWLTREKSLKSLKKSYFWASVLGCVGSLNACASADYPKEVLIPTKCDIPARVRPALENGAIVDYVKNLLIYTENLENDLAFCRGDTAKKDKK